MIRGTDVLQNETKEEKMRCLGNESWWKIILSACHCSLSYYNYCVATVHEKQIFKRY